VVHVNEILERDIFNRLRRQHVRFPAGFPCDRNGIRLGLASVEDELKETLEAWQDEKRQPFTRTCKTYDELLDLIACAIYIAEGFHADTD